MSYYENTLNKTVKELQNMKTFIKCQIIKFLALFGYELMRVRKWKEAGTYNILPLIVEHVISQKKTKDFIFVQIGSNDGVSGDPIYPLLKKHPEWTGLFVEPNPDVFKKLTSLYPEKHNLSFANVAITDYDGKITLHLTPNDDRNSSINADIAKIANHQCKTPTTPVVVDCVTLNTLFANYNVKDIDLFHVDAEGCDYKIITQLLRQTSVRPGILQFEHQLTSMTEYESLCSMLTHEGYNILPVGIDTIAVRQMYSPVDECKAEEG